MTKRWWKYAVLRGTGVPVNLQGMWMDIDSMPGGEPAINQLDSAMVMGITFTATNEWESREDGEVAVVYRSGPVKKYDCEANREPDEPSFTLLARDIDAPWVVKHWASLRENRLRIEGKFTPAEQDQVSESYEIAGAMVRWREAHRP